MATLTMTDAAKQHAHELIDRIPPDEMMATVRFLEFMVSQVEFDGEEISEDEAETVARSKEWLKHNKGIPFEEVVAELGFTMEQIRNHKAVDL